MSLIRRNKTKQRKPFKKLLIRSQYTDLLYLHCIGNYKFQNWEQTEHSTSLDYWYREKTSNDYNYYSIDNCRENVNHCAREQTHICIKTTSRKLKKNYMTRLI